MQLHMPEQPNRLRAFLRLSQGECMATKSRSSTSNIIRNINSAAESRAVRSTGKYVVKGIENTAKWMATDHIGTSHLASMMEFQQSMNYSNASLNLQVRRLVRFDITDAEPQ
jgi:hypothetical protein